jgi:hypothetical protein
LALRKQNFANRFQELKPEGIKLEEFNNFKVIFLKIKGVGFFGEGRVAMRRIYFILKKFKQQQLMIQQRLVLLAFL